MLDLEITTKQTLISLKELKNTSAMNNKDYNKMFEPG